MFQKWLQKVAKKNMPLKPDEFKTYLNKFRKS